MADEPIGQQWPDVLAMVLADAVLLDPVNGKFFIQGTYSVILAPHFPWTHPSLIVYYAITNGHGKTEIKLRLIDVDDAGDPIFSASNEIDFSDPLLVVEGIFAARQIVFPAPGEYRLQLFGAGEHLRERRLQVIPSNADADPERQEDGPS